MIAQPMPFTRPTDQRGAVRGVLATLMLALSLLAAPAAAQQALTYGDETWAQTREALFEALKEAPDPATAQRTADLIWRFWFTAPDEETSTLMQQAMERRQVYDFAGAIEILDKVVEHAPDYPEGWNQRATVLFFQEKYDRSLEDVERVLELEPKHFGALAGKGVILLRQGRAALAHKALRQAVAIHPFLPERQLLPKDPSQEL